MIVYALVVASLAINVVPLFLFLLDNGPNTTLGPIFEDGIDIAEVSLAVVCCPVDSSLNQCWFKFVNFKIVFEFLVLVAID